MSCRAASSCASLGANPMWPPSVAMGTERPRSRARQETPNPVPGPRMVMVPCLASRQCWADGAQVLLGQNLRGEGEHGEIVHECRCSKPNFLRSSSEMFQPRFVNCAVPSVTGPATAIAATPDAARRSDRSRCARHRGTSVKPPCRSCRSRIVQGCGPLASTMAKRACVPPTSPTRIFLARRIPRAPALATQSLIHLRFRGEPVLYLVAGLEAAMLRSEVGRLRDRCVTIERRTRRLRRRRMR